MVRQLAVVSQAVRRARRRRRSDPAPVERAALERLRSELPAEAVASASIVDVPVRRPPWTASGVDLNAGDAVTTFAAGRVYLSGPLNIWVDPGRALWLRVAPEGTIFRGTRDTHSFTAESGGRLELACHPPGDWTDASGGHTHLRGEYLLPSGSLSVLVVRWADGVDSDAVLRGLSSELAAAEIDRRAAAPSAPEGWEHLWRIGAAETYSATADDTMACRTDRDVAILRRAVDFPLTDATRLRWSWRVDQLPSELAEDTLPTHDYLSIALEFDNGQDLTWHWSAALPPGHHYRCPLPHWRGRETHWVVRSGTAELGRWVDEERRVRSDYEQAIGPPPERVVGVWFIAVSVFQGGRGECAYRDIEITDGDRVERPLH